MLTAMKPSRYLSAALSTLLLSAAVFAKLSPQTVDGAIAHFATQDSAISQHVELVAGSVYDGDTFRVRKGNEGNHSTPLRNRYAGIGAANGNGLA